MQCLDARRPLLEELYPDDDLDEMDPILRGNQGYTAYGICPVSDGMVEGYTTNLMMGLESTFG